ncbi:MAG: type II toxin-antitoxin system VapC family toxin [Gaiellaceae bacterium]
MTLIVDTAPLVSLADASEPRRDAVLAALRDEDGPLILPAPATAEIDYLLGSRFAPGAREAFLSDLASGRFTIVCLELGDYATIVDLDRRYSDLGLGLVDCSAIILAARYRTRRILTFDERHFRAVAPLDGGVFTILPADAE